MHFSAIMEQKWSHTDGRNKERKIQNGVCSLGKFNTVYIDWTHVDGELI